jgi:hypothetical protein
MILENRLTGDRYRVSHIWPAGTIWAYIIICRFRILQYTIFADKITYYNFTDSHINSKNCRYKALNWKAILGCAVRCSMLACWCVGAFVGLTIYFENFEPNETYWKKGSRRYAYTNPSIEGWWQVVGNNGVVVVLPIIWLFVWSSECDRRRE